MRSSAPTSSGLVLSRSLLFVPGDDERKIAKARGAGADALIVDLEDAVAISRKDAARQALAATLGELAGAGCLLVRVNALDTGRAEADVDAAVAAGAHGIVAPKIGSRDDLHRFDAMLTDAAEVFLVPLVEMAAALVHLSDIATAASPRVALLALGAGDLVTDLGLPAAAHEDHGGIIDLARMMVVLNSRAAGLRAPLDSPELNVRDTARFRNRCEHARRRGFGGILCIHPSQVEVANEVFAPAPEEVERARSIVEAFDRNEEAGLASITVDGVFVDYPIAEAARRVLETHDLVKEHMAGRPAPAPSTGGPS